MWAKYEYGMLAPAPSLACLQEGVTIIHAPGVDEADLKQVGSPAPLPSRPCPPSTPPLILPSPYR